VSRLNYELYTIGDEFMSKYEAYINALDTERTNCFGSTWNLQPLKNGTFPRYTKIRAIRLKKMEKYFWRAQGYRICDLG
jgi:hypothetical protein